MVGAPGSVSCLHSLPLLSLALPLYLSHSPAPIYPSFPLICLAFLSLSLPFSSVCPSRLSPSFPPVGLITIGIPAQFWGDVDNETSLVRVVSPKAPNPEHTLLTLGPVGRSEHVCENGWRDSAPGRRDSTPMASFKPGRFWNAGGKWRQGLVRGEQERQAGVKPHSALRPRSGCC